LHAEAGVVEPVVDFDQIENILLDSPFGSSDYITEQMHAAFKRRLRKIASHLPPAGQLLDRINRLSDFEQYRVLGDTVVRCAVQHALSRIETGAEVGLTLDQCAQIFSETGKHIMAGEPGPLGSKLAQRIGPSDSYGWVWNDKRPDDVFASAFQQVVKANYDDELPGSISSEELESLRKAVRLLEDLVPKLSRSALSHVHLAAFFPAVGAWSARSSSSEWRVSGTVFLNRKLLVSHWWTAEHLFHESLHQQFYDFRQAHSLFEPGFDRDDAPTICSLWNIPDHTANNYWDAHRSVAAFHVYVHLAFLAMVAEGRAAELEGAYGPQSRPFKIIRSGTALARAHYLRGQIQAAFWDELGVAGKRFVEWFGDVLDVLDPAPPPPGACIHLLLDRYRSEAADATYTLQQSGRSPDFLKALDGLLEKEVSVMRMSLKRQRWMHKRLTTHSPRCLTAKTRKSASSG